MAGAFKSLDTSDVRITPFRAYKAFSGASSYTTYSLAISSTPAELGNDALDTVANLYTTNDILKDSVWKSINHLFYQNYYSNTKASFGPYNFDYQPRLLSPQALMLSLPQRNTGEGLAPNTLELVINGIKYTNDLYNNLIPTTGRWGVDGEISASNVVFSLKPTRLTKDYDNIVDYTTGSVGLLDYATDTYPSSVKVSNCYVSGGQSTTTLTLQQTASIVIYPNAPEYNSAFNFTSRDFAISLTFDPSQTTTTCTLVEKYETNYTIAVDENGNTQTQLEKRIPYSLVYRPSDSKIGFRKSDGITTLAYTSSFTYTTGKVLTLTRSGSTISLIHDSNVEQFTDTFASGGLDYLCSNNSPIYLGSDQNLTKSYGLKLGNVHFYDTYLSASHVNNSLQRADSYYVNNPYATAGNVFPQHGIIVITDNQVVSEATTGITSIQYRGTTTIYENEISCTVSAGEFNFSTNPSLQRYNPISNQYELQGYATASSFKPYITQIGLYDNLGRLLVVSKLSQPIKLPDNVDTTFIVKFDR